MKERFLEVFNVHSTSGDVIENLAMALLEENGLKVENICGQGCGGAANMSGCYKGLHSRILRLNPKAL